MNLSNVPFVAQWWEYMPTTIMAFEIVGFAIMFIIFLLTMKMVYDIYIYVEDDTIRNDLYWLLCSPFFVGLTCMVGNIFPRSFGVLYAIGLTYLMVCLYKVVSLTFTIFGGRTAFSQWLMREGRGIPFATPPLCCCCKCIKPAEPTPANLLRLKYFVEQSPIVRILIQIILVILALEGVADSSVTAQVLNGIGVASTLTGIYVTHIMLTMVGDYLQKYGLNIVFRCADYSQMVYTVLKFILDLISKNHGMGNSHNMSSEAIGDYWFNVAMLFFFLLISVVYAIKIRPGKSELFSSVHMQSKIYLGRGNEIKDQRSTSITRINPDAPDLQTTV